eukprot:1458906-Pyramimonas_sp.AAC.1
MSPREDLIEAAGQRAAVMPQRRVRLQTHRANQGCQLGCVRNAGTSGKAERNSAPIAHLVRQGSDDRSASPPLRPRQLR